MKEAFELSKNYQEIEIKYIKLLAKQIKEIGYLRPTSINRLKILLKAGTNIKKLNKELLKATKLSQKELNKVFEASGISIYELARTHFDLPIAFTYFGLVENRAKSTLKDLINLANSTAIQKQYIKAIDKAIEEVHLGLKQPEQIIRDVLKDETLKGIRVEYASGVTRRLDSAVRMNVAQGMTELRDELQEKIGEDFGADGIEVSAHALCAPDHIFIQGRQFTKDEFKVINEGLHRQIGHLNCYHYTFAIKMGDSPAYTEEQLAKLNAKATKKYEINGKSYTLYEASQLMRRIETRMRYKKEEFIAFREIDDKTEMRKCKQNLKFLRAEYDKICRITGLEPQLYRAFVPDFIRR